MALCSKREHPGKENIRRVFGDRGFVVVDGVSASERRHRVSRGSFAWGYIARLAFIFVGGCLLLAAWPSFKSEWLFSEVEYFVNSQPVRALQANLAAIQANPYAREPRQQLPLTLASLIASPHTLDLQETAADRIHAIGMAAAANNPAVLLSRLYYLMDSGREGSDEILTVLKETSSLQAAVWSAEVEYAARTNDIERLVVAINHGLKLDEPLFRQIAETLGIRIEK